MQDFPRARLCDSSTCGTFRISPFSPVAFLSVMLARSTPENRTITERCARARVRLTFLSSGFSNGAGGSVPTRSLLLAGKKKVIFLFKVPI